MTHIEDAIEAVRKKLGPDYVPHPDQSTERAALMFGGANSLANESHQEFSCLCVADAIVALPWVEIDPDEFHARWEDVVDALSILDRSNDTVSIEEAFADLEVDDV